MTTAAVRPVSIKIDEDIKARVKRLAEARHRTSHWLMREAIRKYLDEEEAIESRNREADAAWAEYQLTGQAVSHDDVAAWLDTWGTDKESPCPTPIT